MRDFLENFKFIYLYKTLGSVMYNMSLNFLQKAECSNKVRQEKCQMEVHEAPLTGTLLGLKTVRWENSNCTRAVSNVKGV